MSENDTGAAEDEGEEEDPVLEAQALLSDSKDDDIEDLREDS